MRVQLICFAEGGRDGRAKYHGGKREKKERRIQARGARISALAPQTWCGEPGPALQFRERSWTDVVPVWRIRLLRHYHDEEYKQTEQKKTKPKKQTKQQNRQNKQTKHTRKQIDKQRNRQADRQTDRQTAR